MSGKCSSSGCECGGGAGLPMPDTGKSLEEVTVTQTYNALKTQMQLAREKLSRKPNYKSDDWKKKK
jgi:hypothetical protein